jgi:hypothetical protein
MNKKILENKLKEIDLILKSEYLNENHVGIHSGLSGIALFQAHYSKYLKLSSQENFGANVISHSISKINNGYNYPTFCNGIAGLGWTIDYLNNERLLSIDCDGLLSELDDFLYENMVNQLQIRNYDFLHGAIGIAMYFLNRYRSTKLPILKNKYKTILIKFIELLDGISENVTKEKIKWLTTSNHLHKQGCDLSLSHGMSSISGILIKLSKYDDFKFCKELLKKAIYFINDFINKENNSLSLFPNWVGMEDKNDYNSRLAWCYGDLGIGLQFWYASKIFKSSQLMGTAMYIFHHSSKRKIFEDTFVMDSSICHGAFGLAQIFGRIYKETENIKFKNCSEYWLEEGLKFGQIDDNAFAGFQTWNNSQKKWENNSSLLEGISGIGLVILDYLNGNTERWDECLMIS